MYNTDILNKLDNIWMQVPNKAMLVCDHAAYDYHGFRRELARCMDTLQTHQPKTVALLADNSVHWVIFDLACQLLDIPLLPLPTYFSLAQMRHSIKNAGADLLIVETALPGAMLSHSLEAKVVDNYNHFELLKLSAKSNAQLPLGTGKITFTSGSTGEPKGVCLSTEHQWQVAQSIQQRVNLQTKRHLCILPLPTLLENVAGVYAALLNGTTVMLPGLNTLGFKGSSNVDIEVLLEQVSQLQPSSLITTPELLAGLIGMAELGWQVPTSLKFVAVGGARVAPGLLTRAERVGLNVYQGYGLSECGSVVSLNGPEDNQTDTMGALLSHAKVTIEQGEVMVENACFLGYANQPESWHQGKVATGDLGELSEDGHLTVTGRKSNLLISSFGRNINPEWVESELLSSGLIRQAFVFGDGQPYCVAAIAASSKSVRLSHIEQWVKQVNFLLPDYAQIKRWFLLEQPIVPDSGLITANGRPKRALLEQSLQSQIEQLYPESALQEAI